MNDLMKKIQETLKKSNLKNKSTRKGDLFKKELFEGLSINEEKRTRKEYRDTALSFCELIINSKSKKDIADFKEFFSQVYNVEFSINAFDTLQKEYKKKIVADAFAIITEIENANKKKQ